MSSYIHYKGTQRITPEQSIELQKRILDPTSVPSKDGTGLRTHSAVKAIEKRLTVDKALALQQKIINGSD